MTDLQTICATIVVVTLLIVIYKLVRAQIEIDG